MGEIFRRFADDIEDEAHLYESGEMPAKDGKEASFRRISIFIFFIFLFNFTICQK